MYELTLGTQNTTAEKDVESALQFVYEDLYIFGLSVLRHSNSP